MKKLSSGNVWLILLIGLFFFAASTANVLASQSAGSSEIQVSGSFQHASGSKVGALSGDFSYGYFVSPAWQLGLRQTLSYNFIDDAKDTWLASTAPFVNYHFRGFSANESFQPFLGAFLGAAYNDKRGSGMIGPHVGLKTFMNDKTFLLTQYRYEWFWNKMKFGDMTDTTRGNNVVTIGVGFLF